MTTGTVFAAAFLLKIKSAGIVPIVTVIRKPYNLREKSISSTGRHLKNGLYFFIWNPIEQ